jgi:hypothetical protein
MLTAVDLTAASPASLAIPGAESNPAKSDAGSTDPENLILSMTEPDLLKKPEYIHVVLNHLPIYGTIVGALALSLILRSRATQITALILTLIAGASAYPVFITGQRAYKTIRGLGGGPIRHPEFRTSEAPDPQAKCSAL